MFGLEGSVEIRDEGRVAVMIVSEAIDYRAEGGRLLMLVFKKKKGKDDEVIVPGIAQKRRGVGTQDYKGRGRYYIEIRGLGHWTIRVRDGA